MCDTDWQTAFTRLSTFITVGLHYVPLTLARSGNLFACSPHRGRDNAFGKVTYCGMNGWGSNPGGGKCFRFSTHVKSIDGADPKIHTENIPGDKKLGRRIYHPPPSSVEVQTGWSYTSTPSLYLQGILQEELYLLTC
jgi:hypothetical protein